MKQVSITRDVAAPPEAVWAAITDAGTLVRLDTGITGIDGSIGAGRSFGLRAEASGSRTFRITVSDFDAPRRMEWRSGNAVFRGVRVFTLTPTATGTRLDMTETFTGLMLPLIWRTMPDLTPSFAQFAAAIAAHTERKAA